MEHTIKYSGYTFSHAFKFSKNVHGQEIPFNIMVTQEMKNNMIRYVGVCLDNGIESRSKESDISVALSSIVCDTVRASLDIYQYHKNRFPGETIEFAGAINDPHILEVFNKIEQTTSSLAFYREIWQKVQFGGYLSGSRLDGLAKNDALLNFLSTVRMVLNKPVHLDSGNLTLSGRELMGKYKISKYVAKISEILSLSRLFEEPKIWERFCYVALSS